MIPPPHQVTLADAVTESRKKTRVIRVPVCFDDDPFDGKEKVYPVVPDPCLCLETGAECAAVEHRGAELSLEARLGSTPGMPTTNRPKVGKD